MGIVQQTAVKQGALPGEAGCRAGAPCRAPSRGSSAPRASWPWAGSTRRPSRRPRRGTRCRLRRGRGRGAQRLELEQLQLDGHVVLPGVLNEETIGATILDAHRRARGGARGVAGGQQAELQAMLQQPQLAMRRARPVPWSQHLGPGRRGLRMGIGQVVGGTTSTSSPSSGTPRCWRSPKVRSATRSASTTCARVAAAAGDQGMGYHSHDCALQLSAALRPAFLLEPLHAPPSCNDQSFCTVRTTTPTLDTSACSGTSTASI